MLVCKRHESNFKAIVSFDSLYEEDCPLCVTEKCLEQKDKEIDELAEFIDNTSCEMKTMQDKISDLESKLNIIRNAIDGN